MSSFEYKLSEGVYSLYDGEEMLTEAGGTVAIAYSEDDVVCLHKHGSPKAVYGWYEMARNKYQEAGFGEYADRLKVVEGKFSVEDLNKIINNTGFLELWLKRNSFLGS